MSILEKYSAAIKNKDEAVMNDLLHDDFKFTMHKSGNVLGKGDVIKWAMSGDINQDKVRVVYENDEVGVHYSSRYNICFFCWAMYNCNKFSWNL